MEVGLSNIAAGASLGVQSFGAGANAVGAYYSAQAQKSTLNAQANIDDLNAKLQEMTAQSELLSGQRQEQASNISYANLKASQKAAFAANGIDLSSQTPVNVLTSTDVLKQIDASTIAANAGRAAFGARQQGLSYTNRARGARATASGITPLVSAGTSLLTGAGSVAQSWYMLNKEGAFDTQKDTGGTIHSPSDYGWIDRAADSALGVRNLVSDTLF